MEEGHTYRLRQGGLLRCCILTLDTFLDSVSVEPAVGTVVVCSACRDRVRRAVDGVWEWDHD